MSTRYAPGAVPMWTLDESPVPSANLLHVCRDLVRHLDLENHPLAAADVASYPATHL